jgi:hypothetical protein
VKGKLTAAALAVVITGIALPMTAHADTISATPPSASPSPSQGIGEPAYPETNYVPTLTPSAPSTPDILPPDVAPEQDAGELAVTGANDVLLAVWGGLGFIAIGGTLALVARVRRRA